MGPVANVELDLPKNILNWVEDDQEQPLKSKPRNVENQRKPEPSANVPTKHESAASQRRNSKDPSEQIKTGNPDSDYSEVIQFLTKLKMKLKSLRQRKQENSKTMAYQRLILE